MKLKDKINRKRAEINLMMADPVSINSSVMATMVAMIVLGSGTIPLAIGFLGVGFILYSDLCRSEASMKFNLIKETLPRYENPLQNIFQKLLFFAYWKDDHWAALNEKEYKFLREEFLKSDIAKNMSPGKIETTMPDKRSKMWDADFLFPLMLEKIGEDGCREVLRRLPVDFLLENILNNDSKFFKYVSRLTELRDTSEKIIKKKIKNGEYNNQGWVGFDKEIAEYLLKIAERDNNSVWKTFVLKKAEYYANKDIINLIKIIEEKNKIGAELNKGEITKKNKI